MSQRLRASKLLDALRRALKSGCPSAPLTILHGDDVSNRSHAVTTPAEVLDPVCGMTISTDDAVGSVEHRGHTYYFCNQSCVDQFRANPDAFLGERPSVPVTSADMERDYICPMDPEVR